MKDQDRRNDMSENEGEGSRSAARRYNEEAEKFAKEQDVHALADEAAREVDAQEESDEEYDEIDDDEDEEVAFEPAPELERAMNEGQPKKDEGDKEAA